MNKKRRVITPPAGIKRSYHTFKIELSEKAKLIIFNGGNIIKRILTCAVEDCKVNNKMEKREGFNPFP
ncbi:hypothetical protein [Bacillus litorisediminis]|uniref:hypothetical protein n=1 Tax=Bacillus litorisediminis TaxID=2922713 RepID=UPI001FAEBF07|nr:hypothetical protein [Bacillus litorisediminis]